MQWHIQVGSVCRSIQITVWAFALAIAPASPARHPVLCLETQSQGSGERGAVVCVDRKKLDSLSTAGGSYPKEKGLGQGVGLRLALSCQPRWAQCTPTTDNFVWQVWIPQT